MKKIFSLMLILIVGLFLNLKVKAANIIVSGYNNSITASYSGTITMSYGATIMKKWYNDAARAFCTRFWYSAPTGTCTAVKWNNDDNTNKKIATAIGAMINKARSLSGGTPGQISDDNYFYGEMAINNFLYYYNGKNSANQVSKMQTWSTIASNANYKAIYAAGTTAYNSFGKTTMQITSPKITLDSVAKKVSVTATVTCYNKDGKTINCSAPCNGTLTLDITKENASTSQLKNQAASCKRNVSGSNIYYTYSTTNPISIGDDATKVKATISLKNKTSNPVAQNYNCGSNYQTLTPNDVRTLYTYYQAKKSVSTDVPGCAIKFNKVNELGSPLKGATFQLYNSSNVVVDTAISDANGNVIFDGLDPNTNYYYKETKSPTGYKLNSASNSVTTNAISNGECPTKVVASNFVNEQQTASITIKKTDGPDGTGNFVQGAKIKVYTVTEIDGGVPSGSEYMDETPITDEGDEGEGGVFDLNDNNNYEFTFLHFDENGNYNPNGAYDYFITDGNPKTISGLSVGETYYIYEESSPENTDYAPKVRSDSVELTSATNYVVNLQNIHSKFKISKQDITNKKELPGATIKIVDSRGVDVESWVSTTTPKEITGLPDGQYKLIEITAPKGYQQAESIDFTIEDGKLKDDEDNTLVMYDDVLKVEVPDTLSARNILIIIGGLAIVAAGLGIFLYGIRKKDEI